MSRLFKLEKRSLKIGFVPLTDCAPLVVAQEMGFFKKWGFKVQLLPQPSWQVLQQALYEGKLDAAHMLAPMPLASSLGLDGEARQVITPLVLSRNGNAITISQGLHEQLLEENNLKHISLPLSSGLLKKVMESRQQQGLKLRFATVYPYSCHYYQLLAWLEMTGIDASDVDIIIMPPVEMVSALEANTIDGFCVGGPWNAKAVRQGVGVTGVTSSDIWPDSPEKVLGMLAHWQSQYPESTMALVAALQEACSWLATVPNRFEAARMLARPEYLNTDIDIIAPSLLGSCLTHQHVAPRYVPSYNQFSAVDKNPGNSPDQSYAEWILNYMKGAGHLGEKQVPSGWVSSVYREDIYQAVKDILFISKSNREYARGQ